MIEPKPLIVLFDEVDVLEGETMISFLHQLRGGFAGRGIGKFPISIALVEMHPDNTVMPLYHCLF